MERVLNPVSRMREYPKEVNIAFLKTNKWIEGVGEEAIPTITPATRCSRVRASGSDPYP